jgi:hypothetical protein
MPGASTAEILLIEGWETYNNWLAHGTMMYGFAPSPLPDSSTLRKRYAYGADPQGNDASGFPRPFMLADGMTVRVKQPVGRQGVSYAVKGFTNLADINGSNVGFTEVPAPEGQPSGPDWKYYRLNAKGASSGFIKVDVEVQ